MAKKQDSKGVASFHGVVPAGSVDKVFEYFLRKNGTIEEIRNRIYSGSVGLLEIRPFLVSHGDVWNPLIKYPDGANQFLSGDDDRDVYDTTQPFHRGDRIVVLVTNKGSYDYDLNMAMTLDYYGGDRRVI